MTFTGALKATAVFTLCFLVVAVVGIALWALLLVVAVPCGVYIVLRYLFSKEPRMDISRDVLIVRYRKDNERYLFIGNDTPENRRELDRVLLMFACRGDLSLSFAEAAALGRAVRKENLERCEGR